MLAAAAPDAADPRPATAPARRCRWTAATPRPPRLERARRRRQARARTVGARARPRHPGGAGPRLRLRAGRRRRSRRPRRSVGRPGGPVRIPLSTFRDGQPPALPVDGRRPAGALHRHPGEANGEIATAFDACLICGPHGYYQEGPTSPACTAARRSTRRRSASPAAATRSPLPAGRGRRAGHRRRRPRGRRGVFDPAAPAVYLRLLAESVRRGPAQAPRRRRGGARHAGVTALAGVLLASGDRLAAEMGSYGANLSLASAREGETLPVEALEKLGVIFWRNNIKAAAPLLPLRVRVGEAVVPLVVTLLK